ncbi:MAG: hypothetical protein O3C40_19570 [Planctomycetota bacterium]|nr:hypothetical protein [Planctomycetota bacterium]
MADATWQRGVAMMPSADDPSAVRASMAVAARRRRERCDAFGGSPRRDRERGVVAGADVAAFDSMTSGDMTEESASIAIAHRKRGGRVNAFGSMGRHEYPDTRHAVSAHNAEL